MSGDDNDKCKSSSQALIFSFLCRIHAEDFV